MSASSPAWYHIANESTLPTPSLLIFRDRVEHNLRTMIEVAGSATRLRPHVKTHKMAKLIERQVELGIAKFKCSTIAEAEMCATNGGSDVMIALPCVGENAQRLVRLAQQLPAVKFSTIADNLETVSILSGAAQAGGVEIGVYVELDCGMARTGIVPGEGAHEIVQSLLTAPGLRFAGLHAYDGHIHAASLAEREELCEAAFVPVLAFRAELESRGVVVKEFLAGGSPTFGIHARHPDRTLSPGTTVLWDFGYGDKHPDLPFLPAAVLLTRVISKPGKDRITVDLGHKSVAPENPHPRVRFEELPEAEFIMQSEEHLVMQVPNPQDYAIGQALHGIPRHVCPTVSMFGEACIIDDGVFTTTWPVTARNRKLTI
jgi:D-serine deaminase-like pyridoxal phosphate-dependent protein